MDCHISRVYRNASPPRPGLRGMDPVPTTGWLAKCLGNSTASPLGEDDLEALLAVSRVRRVGADELLFARSEAIQDVYIDKSITIA